MFGKTKKMLNQIFVWFALAKKGLVNDTRGTIDIGKIVTLVVTTMVGAIILGALLPSFSTGLATLSKKVPKLESLIEILPMLVALIFVVAVVFVLLGMLKTGKK